MTAEPGGLTEAYEKACEDLKKGILPKMINGVIQERCSFIPKDYPRESKDRDPGEEG